MMSIRQIEGTQTVIEKVTEDISIKPVDQEVHYNFPGAKYKVQMDEKADILIIQTTFNAEYIEELLKKKLAEPRNNKVLQISNYLPISLFELFVRAHDPHHKSSDDDKCSICMSEFFEDVKKVTINDIVDDLTVPKSDDNEVIRLAKCDGHFFHLGCILNYIKSQPTSYIKCPNCTTIYGTITGEQPPGTMSVTVDNRTVCAGYSCPTIIINYRFPSGTLPNGKYYHGTNRIAYLPDNEEGREVLGLLKMSFERKLTFIVGTSLTTGRTDCVVWNGVHHKTNPSGGPTSFGYPDATYFNRVKLELSSRGVN